MLSQQYRRGYTDGQLERIRREPRATDRHARRMSRAADDSGRAYYLGWARGFRS